MEYFYRLPIRDMKFFQRIFKKGAKIPCQNYIEMSINSEG